MKKISGKRKIIIGCILVSPTVLYLLVSAYFVFGWVELIGVIFVAMLIVGISFIINGFTL